MSPRKRLEIKLPPELFEELKATARSRGFTSANSLVRAAITNELRSGASALERTEQNIAATIERLVKEVRGLHTTLQGQFALIDNLVRLFLTCVPEPPAEVLQQAKARAKLRYDRFLLAVAQGMASGATSTTRELNERGNRQ
jgi:Arc/MetJ-type ribon-helix-helix transcriptional regulator